MSLGEISHTDFIIGYRNNLELAKYFENRAKWIESIGDPELLLKNSSTEYNFLANAKDALGIQK